MKDDPFSRRCDLCIHFKANYCDSLKCEVESWWTGCIRNTTKEMVMLERLPRNELKRFLVCGGRDYADWQFMRKKLKVLLEEDWMFILVHGDCRGADRLAAGWAKACELIVEAYPADWAKYGRAAGAIRNQEMLDSGIDGVIAFPGGKGTANMIKIAIQAGVPVWDLRNGDV